MESKMMRLTEKTVLWLLVSPAVVGAAEVASTAGGGAAVPAGAPAPLWLWITVAVVVVVVAAAVMGIVLRRTGEKPSADAEWSRFSRTRDRVRLNLLRSLEDRIVVYDKDIKIIGKYGRLEKTDYSTSEVRGVSLADALVTLPDDEVEMHIAPVRRALGGETVVYEWSWHQGDSGGRMYQTKVCPVRNEKLEIVGAASVSRDITSIRRGTSA